MYDENSFTKMNFLFEKGHWDEPLRMPRGKHGYVVDNVL